MKVTINIDCTPQEARTFLGLPDVQPMQERLLAELEHRMQQNIRDMEPEALVNKWLPLGLQGLEQFQKALWSSLMKTGQRDGGSKE